MTDIIFSFDTEDFTSDIADNCVLEEARLLTEEGIRGCFCVVGLLAKRLLERKRYDVIEALLHHEIDFHTYSHSVIPIIDVMTDIDDALLAKELVKAQENIGMKYFEKTFNKSGAIAVVPPGNEASYAAMYAYAEMGIPIYAGTCCDTYDGRGLHYCNMYHMEYTEFLERTLFDGTDEDFEKLLDRVAQKKHSVLYTHPNMARFEEFWDSKNYTQKNPHNFGEWKDCKQRSEEETERFYNNFRKLIRLIKNDSRFNITTYEEIMKRDKITAEREIKLTDIPLLKESIFNSFYPVNKPVSLSISDIFGACTDFLKGKKVHKCNTVYGFLRSPYKISAPCRVTKEEMINSVSSINIENYLPEKIKVGEKYIGPADWLRAALIILSGDDEVIINPGDSMPSLDEVPRIKNCSLKGTWLHPQSFEDEYLSERLRLQSWTMRF